MKCETCNKRVAAYHILQHKVVDIMRMRDDEIIDTIDYPFEEAINVCKKCMEMYDADSSSTISLRTN